MSGYTVAFGSMFQGSLCGQWPALPVFCTLLPLADKNGELDYSFGYLARVTGWPEDLLRQGISQLEEADPHSRTPDDDGRRLTRLRPNTEWGWKLVNHAKYREKARLAAKNAREIQEGKNRERQAEKTAAHRRSPPLTADDRLSNSNTNSNKETEGAKAPRASKRCPPDFEPSREYALREIPDLDVDREVQKFRDWEFKTARKDWAAVWRTWIGNARDRGQYAKRAASGLPKVYGETV